MIRHQPVAVALALSALASCPRTPSLAPGSLDDAFARIVADATRGGGRVSVTAMELRTGERASVHGDVTMPLMSVFKLPLAIAALAEVDRGTRSLADVIVIDVGDLRPPPSAFGDATTSTTLRTLVERAVRESDNTAGDKLVSLLGTPTAKLRALGVEGVDIDEQESDIFARIDCFADPRPPRGWDRASLLACPKPTDTARLHAAKMEANAPHNRATSDALVALLARLDRDALLSASSHQLLDDVMAASTTGSARLRAGVPAGTRVAHKTGTGETVGEFNVASNDIGIVTLKSGDRFAIAVLTSGVDEAHRERVISELAKAAWDHWSR
ncbi:MAG TPA: serine hydrolase [Myxococcota bacterium]